LKALEARLAAQPSQVVGIHSPEFERDPERVWAKIEKFRLDHPIMIDNELTYWRALHKRYWPAFYPVDKRKRFAFGMRVRYTPAMCGH
jgi:hypothetical protein